MDSYMCYNSVSYIDKRRVKMKAVFNTFNTLVLLFALVYGAGQLAYDIGYKYAEKHWARPTR